MKRIAFGAIYKPEPGGGYSALCPELGVASQGETIEEAETNLKEAVELYLESARELGILERILSDAGIDIHRIEEHAPKALTGSILAEVEA
jgi:predicted RNase H-like HicB family nuclease